jgi:hypothetical protein
MLLFKIQFNGIQKREPFALGPSGIHSHHIQYTQKAHAQA